MKKGYFINLIAYNKFEDLKSSGIYKKILSQVRELNKHFDVIHETHNRQTLFKNNKLWKLWIRLPFTPSVYKWNYDEKYSNVDFIYFRKSLIDSSVINFLRKIKENNPNIKILFEVPTYPYDKEIRTMKKFPFYLKDKVNRRKLKKIVDRIITFSEDDEIFGVPTIKTINGLDFENIPMRKTNPNTDVINLIAVATIEFWHGYDRVLDGLSEYYKNGGTREIVFHMVGGGTCLESYRKKAHDLSIEKNVIFYGFKSGNELNELYNKAEISISSLGLHRIGLHSASTIKTREYGAKGLPIITSTKTDYLPESYKYELLFPEDDTPIDIKKVVDFFDDIYRDESDYERVNKEIREIAYKACDISFAMDSIVKYISE